MQPAMPTDQTKRSLEFILDQQAQFTADLQHLREVFLRFERVTRVQDGLRMQTTEMLARAMVTALERIDQKLKTLDRRATALSARLDDLEQRAK
jgi:hypothetical protein